MKQSESRFRRVAYAVCALRRGVELWLRAVALVLLPIAAQAASYVVPVATARVRDHLFTTTLGFHNPANDRIRCEAVCAVPNDPRGGSLRATYDIAAATTLVERETLREVGAVGTLRLDCSAPLRIAARIQTAAIDSRSFDAGRVFAGVEESSGFSDGTRSFQTRTDALVMEVGGLSADFDVVVRSLTGEELGRRSYELPGFAQQMINLSTILMTASPLVVELTSRGTGSITWTTSSDDPTLLSLTDPNEKSPAARATAVLPAKRPSVLDQIGAASFKAAPFEDPFTGLVYLRGRWYDPQSGSFLTPDPQGYADSPNPYSFCGGDPVNCSDPTGEIGLRAALTDGLINQYELETLELTDAEIRDIIGSQSALQYAGGDDAKARKDNLARAKFILLGRNSTFREYSSELYQLTRGLNPLHFAGEVGWAIGSGVEPTMNQKINRRDKVMELTTYLLFTKGGQWLGSRLSSIRAKAVGYDGWESVHAPMNDRLTPNQKGKLGEAWSENAIQASGLRYSRNVDLVFTISGRRVTINADRLIHEADGSFVYVESKFSPNAPYQPNQKLVIPELVKSGDQGLVATVGARSGGTLIPGQRIRVKFQGDVWNGSGGLHGQ
jgi:RHS repeat-associated protein